MPTLSATPQFRVYPKHLPPHRFLNKINSILCHGIGISNILFNKASIENIPTLPLLPNNKRLGGGGGIEVVGIQQVKNVIVRINPVHKLKSTHDVKEKIFLYRSMSKSCLHNLIS